MLASGLSSCSCKRVRGGLLRDEVTNRGGDRVLKRDWSTGTSRWAPICKNGYVLARIRQVPGPEIKEKKVRGKLKYKLKGKRLKKGVTGINKGGEG